MFRLIERYFWALCAAATLAGLFVPALGAPLRPIIIVFLAGILFFTALKLNFRDAAAELRRPLLLAYAAVLLLVVLPAGVYVAARAAVPQFAVGLLILAAMPAGMATTSLTDIVRGNAALAIAVTLATSLLVPLTAPLMLAVATGSLRSESVAFFASRAGFLAGVLFAPVAAAWTVRRLWPRAVARHRSKYTALSIVSLALLIVGAMSACSDQTLEMFRQRPGEGVRLMAFLVGFSAVGHLVGYHVAPWRPRRDRLALSITTAYVNNSLGIVFAQQFFVPDPAYGAAAMLPSVLLEIPMVLAIPVVGWLVGRRKG